MSTHVISSIYSLKKSSSCFSVLCRHFTSGNCLMGKECGFLHPGINGPPLPIKHKSEPTNSTGSENNSDTWPVVEWHWGGRHVVMSWGGQHVVKSWGGRHVVKSWSEPRFRSCWHWQLGSCGWGVADSENVTMKVYGARRGFKKVNLIIRSGLEGSWLERLW